MITVQSTWKNEQTYRHYTIPNFILLLVHLFPVINHKQTNRPRDSRDSIKVGKWSLLQQRTWFVDSTKVKDSGNKMASACRRFVPLLKSVCRFSTINRLAAITSKNGITAYSSNVSACRKFGSTMPRIQKETWVND